MTGKERILAAMAGERPDQVPSVPNIWQWFYVNQAKGTLPEELKDCADPVDVLRALGADVFSKFDGLVVNESLNNCNRTVEYSGERPPGQPEWSSFCGFEEGNVRSETIETPHGTLTHVWKYESTADAPFEAEHWWKDFDAEYAAVRDWMADADWQVDHAALRAGVEKVGDDGLILLQLLPSPLKQFHWLVGQDKSTFFMMDHPDEMDELARIHEEKSLEVLEQVVDDDDVWVFEVADNLDSQFYSPRLFRQYCLPTLQKMARMVHQRGKYLFIHACGKLKHLGPLILEAELDCVEGQAHPPLGDWPLEDARALSEQLIVCGGMTAAEQSWSGPGSAGRIDDYVRRLFTAMGNKRRFLFGSGCNTAPETAYENLEKFQAAAVKYGAVE